MELKKLIPELGKAKVLDGKVEIWKHGNCRWWYKPKVFRIGFSGSNADPYHSFHIYLWKLDITWWRNPFLKPMKFWMELKQDWYQWREGERCPYCNSFRLRDGNGMAYEPIVYCKSCGAIVWEPEDITPYII